MSSTVFMTSPISIHAPREGSDGLALPVSTSTSNFYPRSPRGERHGHLPTGWPNHKFLSTLPARGATVSHLLHILVPQ